MTLSEVPRRDNISQALTGAQINSVYANAGVGEVVCKFSSSARNCSFDSAHRLDWDAKNGGMVEFHS
jgi:hypothetical protein